MGKRTDITGAGDGDVTARAGVGKAVADFIAEARAAPREGGGGRLIFALDATMSRQPTWDLACRLQAEMFQAAEKAGGLAVQLVYYRGNGEAQASRWVADGAGLAGLMTGIACRGGLTQIGRVLDHAARVAARGPLPALVFVGDAVEEEPDRLCDAAARLALLGTRAFVFHEGGDAKVGAVFREVARVTRGAYLPFDAAAARELGALLAAIAAYAAGGRAALEAAGTGAARRLLADLRP